MKQLVAALLAVLIGGGALIGDQRTMGDATPNAEAVPYSIVGTWRGAEFGYLYTFAADGTAIATAGDQITFLGAWQPDGAGGAMFIFERVRVDGVGEGFSGWARLGDDADELLIGKEALERVVPPTLEQFLEGKATPMP